MTGLSASVTRDGAGRCVAEHDRGGALLSALVWKADGLAVASLRLPDTAWLTIEPGRGVAGPWGASDRLGVSAMPLAAPDTPGTRALTVMSALDWHAVDRIPVVAEPARLPPGAPSAVLNLVAALTRDQRRTSLRYDGPYPGEALFLALLESFHYDSRVAEPLAAFGRGNLAWTPVPHERLLVGDGMLVQWRGRVEKVIDGPRAYVRPDWQAVTRYAPRRVRDGPDGGVRCSLMLLGEVLEDHLLLDVDGTFRASLPSPADEPQEQAWSPDLVGGLAAAVAALSAAPLRGPIERAARRLAPVWGPVDRDLVEVRHDRLVISHRVRRALRRRLGAGAPDANSEAALAGLAELAALVGDTLRARAQAALAAAPADVQWRAVHAPEAGDDAAPRIALAARALREQLAG